MWVLVKRGDAVEATGAYLVAEAAHADADGVLDDMEGVVPAGG